MKTKKHDNRRGATLLLIVVFLVVVMAMMAFAIDYGFLLQHESKMQRANDAAVLAAVVEIIPDANSLQYQSSACTTATDIIRNNLGDSFVVNSSDVVLRKYDAATIYNNGSPQLGTTGIMDTVEAVIRRDPSTNGSLSLFFARAMGAHTAAIATKSTAVLRRGNALLPGSYVIPFALHEDDYNQAIQDDGISVLYDDQGVGSPGNFGIVDVGRLNNSSADVTQQISNGLRELDFYGGQGLEDQGLLDPDGSLPTDQTYWLNTGPGLKANVEKKFEEIVGQTRIIPIYEQTNGENGENLDYKIVMWAVVQITNVDKAVNPLLIEVKPSFRYDNKIRPNLDLSNNAGTISGAFTSPALIE